MERPGDDVSGKNASATESNDSTLFNSSHENLENIPPTNSSPGRLTSPQIKSEPEEDEDDEYVYYEDPGYYEIFPREEYLWSYRTVSGDLSASTVTPPGPLEQRVERILNDVEIKRRLRDDWYGPDAEEARRYLFRFTPPELRERAARRNGQFFTFHEFLTAIGATIDFDRIIGDWTPTQEEIRRKRRLERYAMLALDGVRQSRRSPTRSSEEENNQGGLGRRQGAFRSRRGAGAGNTGRSGPGRRNNGGNNARGAGRGGVTRSAAGRSRTGQSRTGQSRTGRTGVVGQGNGSESSSDKSDRYRAGRGNNSRNENSSSSDSEDDSNNNREATAPHPNDSEASTILLSTSDEFANAQRNSQDEVSSGSQNTQEGDSSAEAAGQQLQSQLVQHPGQQGNGSQNSQENIPTALWQQPYQQQTAPLRSEWASIFQGRSQGAATAHTQDQDEQEEEDEKERQKRQEEEIREANRELLEQLNQFLPAEEAPWERISRELREEEELGRTEAQSQPQNQQDQQSQQMQRPEIGAERNYGWIRRENPYQPEISEEQRRAIEGQRNYEQQRREIEAQRNIERIRRENRFRPQSSEQQRREIEADRNYQQLLRENPYQANSSVPEQPEWQARLRHQPLQRRPDQPPQGRRWPLSLNPPEFESPSEAEAWALNYTNPYQPVLGQQQRFPQHQQLGEQMGERNPQSLSPSPYRPRRRDRARALADIEEGEDDAEGQRGESPAKRARIEAEGDDRGVNRASAQRRVRTLGSPIDLSEQERRYELSGERPQEYPRQQPEGATEEIDNPIVHPFPTGRSLRVSKVFNSKRSRELVGQEFSSSQDTEEDTRDREHSPRIVRRSTRGYRDVPAADVIELREAVVERATVHARRRSQGMQAALAAAGIPVQEGQGTPSPTGRDMDHAVTELNRELRPIRARLRAEAAARNEQAQEHMNVGDESSSTASSGHLRPNRPRPQGSAVRRHDGLVTPPDQREETSDSSGPQPASSSTAHQPSSDSDLPRVRPSTAAETAAPPGGVSRVAPPSIATRPPIPTAAPPVRDYRRASAGSPRPRIRRAPVQASAAPALHPRIPPAQVSAAPAAPPTQASAAPAPAPAPLRRSTRTRRPTSKARESAVQEADYHRGGPGSRFGGTQAARTERERSNRRSQTQTRQPTSPPNPSGGIRKRARAGAGTGNAKTSRGTATRKRVQRARTQAQRQQTQTQTQTQTQALTQAQSQTQTQTQAQNTTGLRRSRSGRIIKPPDRWGFEN